MPDWMHELIRGHATWAVAVVIGLESMGIPLPGETMLIGAAIYASRMGGLAIEWVLFWAAVGAIVGDNLGYLVGARLGRRALVRWGPKVGLSPDRLLLGEFLFRRHGGKVVFAARFTALLRALGGLLAGALGMPWRRFLLWNAAGGIIWTVGYGLAAYALGREIHKLLGPIGLTVGAAVILLIVVLFRSLRRQEARWLEQAKAAAIGPAAIPQP